MRILVIDDSRVDVDLIEMVIRHGAASEVEIDSAPTLKEGLTKLRKDDFDLTILDLRLPDARLDEGLLRLRQVDDLIPVIVLTGLDDDALAPSLLRAGAQDYVRKSEITSSQLDRVIRYAIERQRLVIQLKNQQETENQMRREIVHLGELLDSDIAGDDESRPFREKSPEKFNELSGKYCAVTERLVRSREQGISIVDTSDAAALATELGKLQANSRDVIALHLECISTKLKGLEPGQHASWMQEARIALVLMLGHLVRFYRRRLH